ncbi:hypothetical protein [Ferrovum sp.]|uniref:hypothetical protein n=1 Tax=Ferrovum sp. TaxID=2609467 RepID=UPI00262D433D|nr:hypothetical protein [Ferrovum sp.]
MKNLMITQEQKVMALSQIHPARDDLDYLERWYPGVLEWFAEKLDERLDCMHKGHLQSLIFELELSHRLGLEPRTGILMQPIFRRLLSYLIVSRLSDYLPLPALLQSLEWPPGGGRGARITMALNDLTSEPLDPQFAQAAQDFAQAHPTPQETVTVTKTPPPPEPAGAHGGQAEEPDEIDELLNVEW